MSELKLIRIMKTLSERLQGITIANGYHTDIGKGVQRYPRVFNEDECPACSIHLGLADQTDIASGSIKTDPQAIIQASSTYDAIAEDVAIQMLADIHKVIEVSSLTNPQQPDIIRRVNESSWQIIYPENVGRVISVEVIYQFAYHRNYGEP